MHLNFQYLSLWFIHAYYLCLNFQGITNLYRIIKQFDDAAKTDVFSDQYNQKSIVIGSRTAS